MKQKILRVLAAVLAVLMIASLTACTKTPASSGADSKENPSSGVASGEKLYYNKEGYPICDTPITVTLAGANNSAFTPVWNDLLEVKRIEEWFGIKLDCSMYSADAWKNQLTIMLSGNTLPDLVVNAGLGYGDVNADGEKGAYLALDKYADLMPNLTALMAAEPSLKLAMTASDGHYYGLNRYVTDKLSGARFPMVYINDQWLEKVGMKVPTTADELYAVLKAFKEQDANGNGDPNDEIPFGAIDDWSARQARMMLMAMFGMYSTAMGKDDSTMNFYVDKDGKVGLYELTDNYKAYLQYCRNLYKDGLIDSEVYTQTNAQFMEKYNGNKLGMVSYYELMKNNDGSRHLQYSAVCGLTSELTNVKGVALRPGASPAKVMVHANTKYPEAICRLLDYFFTQENLDKFYEGIRFEWKNSTVPGFENVKERSIDACASKAGYEADKKMEYVYTKALIQNGFDSFIVTDAESLFKGMNHAELVELNKKLKASDADKIPKNCSVNEAATADGIQFFDAYPAMGYPSEVNEERNGLIKTMVSYINAQKSQIVLGTIEVDKGWEDMKAALKTQGIDRLLEIEQQTYDKAKG